MAISQETWQRAPANRRRPTYAQVLRSPPRRNRSPSPPRVIRAPNSPTSLLFPPTQQDQGWIDRCYRCFRKGHNKKTCTHPTRCAICWGQGHEFKQCPTKGRTKMHRRADTVPQQRRTAPPTAPKPTDPTYPVRKLIREEPGFQDLLDDNGTHRVALPDDGRPEKFIARDSAFFKGVDELHSAVVVTALSTLLEKVTLDFVLTDFRRATQLPAEKFKVSRLSPAKFLVEMMDGSDAAQGAYQLPDEWWAQGFMAERWSPMIGAGAQAIGFKVWLEFLGLPPHLRKECYVAQAVGLFGVFLGTIPNQDPRDFYTWGATVATPDLRCIPRQVVYTAGAVEYLVRIVARRWCSGQVYSALHFPKLPEKIVPPSDRTPVLDFSGDSLTIKLQDLKKIFRHVPVGDLPSDLRAVMVEQNAAVATDTKGKKVTSREEVVVQLLRRNLTVVSNGSAGDGENLVPPPTKPVAKMTKDPP